MEIVLTIRLVNFIILLCVYIFILISALTSLKKRQLSRGYRAFWLVVIIFYPVLGPIAFWIVNPGNKTTISDDAGVLKA